MKKVLPGIVVLFSCMMLIYACNDHCKGTYCEHCGECVQGVCKCPPAFIGTNCETPNPCRNGGIYVHGSPCQCQPGYEGDSCEKRITDRIAGIYQAKDDCNSGIHSYIDSVYSTGNAADFKVRFSNIHTFYVDATYHNDSLTVLTPQQTGAFNVSGSGHVNVARDSIFMNVTFTEHGNPANTFTCNFTLKKQ